MGHAVGNRDVGQTGAGTERIISDSDHTVGDDVGVACFGLWILDEHSLGLVEQDSIRVAVKDVERIHSDRRQTAASVECHVSNTGHAVGNRDLTQTAAGSKCILSDLGHTARNDDVGQTGAGSETIGSDAGHAVGNRDTGHAEFANERGVADPRNGQTRQHAGDDYRATWSRVARDGNLTVIVYVSELSMSRRAKRQKQQERQQPSGVGDCGSGLRFHRFAFQ